MWDDKEWDASCVFFPACILKKLQNSLCSFLYLNNPDLPAKSITRVKDRALLTKLNSIMSFMCSAVIILGFRYAVAILYLVFSSVIFFTASRYCQSQGSANSVQLKGTPVESIFKFQCPRSTPDYNFCDSMRLQCGSRWCIFLSLAGQYQLELDSCL